LGEGGLTNFRNGQCQWWCYKNEPLKMAILEEMTTSTTTLTRTRHGFTLDFFYIGKEEWATVISDGNCIVPPFKFEGWLYLPGQSW
jgi:hypothetical protein